MFLLILNQILDLMKRFENRHLQIGKEDMNNPLDAVDGLVTRPSLVRRPVSSLKRVKTYENLSIPPRAEDSMNQSPPAASSYSPVLVFLDKNQGQNDRRAPEDVFNDAFQAGQDLEVRVDSPYINFSAMLERKNAYLHGIEDNHLERVFSEGDCKYYFELWKELKCPEIDRVEVVLAIILSKLAELARTRTWRNDPFSQAVKYSFCYISRLASTAKSEYLLANVIEDFIFGFHAALLFINDVGLRQIEFTRHIRDKILVNLFRSPSLTLLEIRYLREKFVKDKLPLTHFLSKIDWRLSLTDEEHSKMGWEDSPGDLPQPACAI